MSRRITFAIAGALVALSLDAADAQRTRTSPTRTRQMGRAAVKPLGTGDLEKLNPAKVLIDGGIRLELDPTQRALLDTLARQYQARIKSYDKGLDTLQSVLSRRVNLPPPDARVDSARVARIDREIERIQNARNLMLATLLAIKADFDSSSTRAAAVLREDQRGMATSILGATAEQVTDLLHRENLRARGG